MILQINKSEFSNKYLGTIGKLCDQCIININKDGMYSIVGSETSETILYIKQTGNGSTEDVKLNIGNIKKLQNILNCIDQDNIDLEVNDSYLQYKSNLIKFKYHLFENDIIKKCPLNISKIESFKWNTDFTLTKEIIQNILKMSTFIPDIQKIYMYTNDGKVYGEITDNSQHNTDNVTLCISESFNGNDIQPISIDIETIRSMSTLKKDINVGYNSDVKVLVFNIVENILSLKYIISTYIN